MQALTKEQPPSPPQKQSFKLGWEFLITGTLLGWLVCSLFLDLVVMPSLYWAGMMDQPGFAGAGYVLFGTFNQLELLAGSTLLVSLLSLERAVWPLSRRRALAMALGLWAIAALYSYWLTPQMSALGLSLDGTGQTQITPVMEWMQWSYWGLECLKLSTIFLLLRGFLPFFSIPTFGISSLPKEQ